ncbi:MAG: OmpA family protein [Gammaproteobacteria bacterium]|nr:OmpA family protein [Gammaproteobacteria bacterium]
MNNQIRLIAMILCNILITGCSSLQSSKTDTITVFSHSNPLREQPTLSASKNTPIETVAITDQRQASTLYFANNSHKISSDANAKLLGLSTNHTISAWRPIVIEGHTDSNSSEAYNMLLAKKRIKSVKAVLISLGYSDDQIIERPKGETEPVVSNDTSLNRQLNRRVEIQLY